MEQRSTPVRLSEGKNRMVARDISESLGKLPPQAPEIEESVLGAVMLERDAINHVGKLKAGHFYSDQHKEIFAACLELKANNNPVDMRTVVNHLRQSGKLEIIGGAYYVAQLTSKVSTSSNIAFHSTIIMEQAMKRELIQIASRIHHDAYEDTSDIFELIEKTENEIFQLKQTKGSLNNVIEHNSAASIIEFKNGKPIGEKSGISDMSEIFSWKRTFINCWTGWPNDGKFEDVNNLIPTPSGFKKMLHIHPGDFVFDEKGNQCKVLRTTDVKLNEECFRIHFNDGSKIVCGAEHLWLTYDSVALRSFYKTRNTALKKRGTDQSHKKAMPKVRTTKEISLTMKGRDGRTNHAIQICQPLNCEYKNLLINPYVLGAWLGDGDSCGGKITGIDEQIFDEIRKSGFNVRKIKAKQRYAIDDLTHRLRKEKVKNNKHIPVEYLFSSFDQRLSLLQGLMDTDGFISKDGKCEFCSCKEKLADDVYSLICSLGIKAGITKSDAKLYGRKTSDRYRITFKTTLKVFRLQRKIDRIPKKVDRSQEFRFIVKCEAIDSVPVKCIQVDSPRCLYLTSRSFIPTHNTTFFQFMATVKSKMDNDFKWCIWSPEMISSRKNESGKIEITATDIEDEIIFTLTGKNPYLHYAKRYNIPQMSLEEYMEAAKWVNEHFIFINPAERKYTDLLDNFKYAFETKGCSGFLIDPYKNLDQQEEGRTDLYLDKVFSDCKKFAIDTNSSFNFIAHPKNQIEPKNSDGSFKLCTQYMLAGGAAWNNNMDGIYSVYRPNSHKSPTDPEVWFYTLKQRKQNLVGRRGVCKNIEFDFLKNRYFFGEKEKVCPIDGSFKNPTQSTIFEKKLHPDKPFLNFKPDEQIESTKPEEQDPNELPF